MLKVDLHVHTVKSDCGFCTLNEMAEEAVKRGVKVLGIADHGPMINVSDTYFKAHFIIPKYFGKTRVLFVESSILSIKKVSSIYLKNSNKDWILLSLGFIILVKILRILKKTQYL